MLGLERMRRAKKGASVASRQADRDDGGDSSNGARYVLAALVAGALFSITGTAALAGVLSGEDEAVGTAIPGGQPSGPPDYRQTADETVVATGVTPIAGDWRLTAYKSIGSWHNGVEVEPAGLPCVRLMLEKPPPGTPIAGRGFCGEQGKNGFSVSSLAVKGLARDVEVVLFGYVPQAARVVALVNPEGKRVMTANVHNGYEGFTGGMWVMPITDLGLAKHGRFEWLDAHGEAGGVSLVAREDVVGQLQALR